MRSQARRGIAAISLAAVLWASIGVCVRLLQDRDALNPTAILWWRLVAGGLLLFAVVGREGVRALRAEARRPARLLAASTCAIGFQLTYFISVADVGVAASTLVCLGVAPIAAVLAESVEHRRRPTTAVLLALLCALVGLALVSTAHANDVIAPRPWRGVALAAASGLLFAASTLVSRRLSVRMSPQALTAGSTLVGLILLTPLAFLPGLGDGLAVPVTARVVGGLVYLGAVTTAVAYVLFYLGLRTTPGGVAMVLTLLEPATAVLLAAVVLGEPITLASGTGAVLVLVAVAVLYLAPSADRPREAADVHPVTPSHP